MSWRPTEYDSRQCDLMREALSSFERGECELPALISFLDASLAAMESAPTKWREAFQVQWWTLEQVHAVALDRSEDPMADENGQLVRRAVARLKHLLSEGAVGSQ